MPTETSRGGAGGIYRRHKSSRVGNWVRVNGTLADTSSTHIAYDSLSNIIMRSAGYGTVAANRARRTIWQRDAAKETAATSHG